MDTIHKIGQINFHWLTQVVVMFETQKGGL